jgi:hypothetical protein
MKRIPQRSFVTNLSQIKGDIARVHRQQFDDDLIDAWHIEIADVNVSDSTSVIFFLFVQITNCLG